MCQRGLKREKKEKKEKKGIKEERGGEYQVITFLYRRDASVLYFFLNDITPVVYLVNPFSTHSYSNPYLS